MKRRYGETYDAILKTNKYGGYQSWKRKWMCGLGTFVEGDE